MSDKIKLNIITRCTRLKNLKTLKSNIFQDQNYFEINWILGFDLNKGELTKFTKEFINLDLHNNPLINLYFFNSMENDYGHSFINTASKICKSEFIYILDDDNILHENFYKRLFEEINLNPDKELFLFNQYVGGKDFSKVEYREANPKNMKLGYVDMAQFCGKNFPENFLQYNNYCADGIFIEDYYRTNPEKFYFIEETLSNYNFITNFLNE